MQVPWEMAVLRTAEGIPYLAPELQLLYKSKGLRAKDEVDARRSSPASMLDERDLLSPVLDADHPWQRRRRALPACASAAGGARRRRRGG